MLYNIFLKYGGASVELKLGGNSKGFALLLAVVLAHRIPFSCVCS